MALKQTISRFEGSPSIRFESKFRTWYRHITLVYSVQNFVSLQLSTYLFKKRDFKVLVETFLLVAEVNKTNLSAREQNARSGTQT